jgi:hypothetical protein
MALLGFSDEWKDFMMRPMMIDLLTIIPIKEIKKYGIPYLKSVIVARDDYEGTPEVKERWVKFWDYFQKIWMTRFKPEDWNVNVKFVMNRTNNPIERYNREVNKVSAETNS